MIALDARVVVDRDLVVHAVRPYAHLAIRPYPEEFVTERKMKDGTPVDPAADQAGRRADVARAAGELLDAVDLVPLQLPVQADHARDGHPLLLHRLRPRDRASWPRWRRKGSGKLIGVGRLVADVDHEAAEYAVIVVDRWHGHGLGGLLTDYCLEVAKRWGVKRIVAETSKDNARMLATFRNRGFPQRRAGAGRGAGLQGRGVEDRGQTV